MPLLLSVGLQVGHRRRAGGPGSGELRGLSATSSVVKAGSEVVKAIKFDLNSLRAES